MKRKVALVTTLLAILLLLPALAYAIPSYTVGDVTVLDYPKHTEDIPLVVNSKGYQAPKYKIGQSKGLAKTSYETKKNTIKPRKYKGVGYKFKTTMFLPIKLRNKGTYSAQNTLIVGKYIYVCYVNVKNNNKGFLARYNYAKIKKLKLTKGKKLQYLRKAFNKKVTKQKLTSFEKKVLKTVKIGPLFKVGHGQTLSYNYKDKELWMAMDLRDKNGKLIPNNTTTIERFNLKTMKPDKAIKFNMKLWTGPRYQTMFTMAFDGSGNCYFTRDYKSYYGLFRMNIEGNTVKVKLVQRIKYGPSKVNHIQSMSYNPYRNTINMIANGALMSFPADKIGQLKPSDFSYVRFKTNREFETIQFDKSGYGYLLVSQGPEILKSTNR